MTTEDAIRLLKEAQQSNDTEGGHVDADNILCQFLADLGHKEIVEEYRKVDKWFS